MSEPNKHQDLSNPFWAAITTTFNLIHYGEISENNVVRSKYVIHNFSNKQDWIAFIESNGGEYVEQELTE